MAWITPIVNWIASNVLTKDDMNRIEGNTLHLYDNKVDKVSGKQLSTEDYTTTEKTKLSGIATGAEVNVPTNIAQGTRTTTTVPITSSTGTGATLSAASTTLAGVMTSTDKTKLDGIATGAQVNTVTSVASKTGAVTLNSSDVGLGNVSNVAQMPIAGGTFTGVATGQANTSYTTRQLRNVVLSTADPSGGSNGDIWLKYKP